MDSMETKKKVVTAVIHIVLILVSITMLVPFLWMILTAFKSVTEATSVDPFVIFPKVWRTDAFKAVVNNMNFLLLYKNTLLLIFFRVVCAVVTATMEEFLLFTGIDSDDGSGTDFHYSSVFDGQQNGYAEHNFCPGISGYGYCIWYVPSSSGIYGTSK